ncbi:MAG: hypothetical protein OEZ03_08210 [Alphaproteobacteria bacterium]|nr:hypothetical protein [Alphaproteobacteria bacterium]
MGTNLYIIWPLGDPAPPEREAGTIYSRVQNFETKTMARWFIECLMGAHMDLVIKLELGPYGFAHWYELIEEEGFPDEPDDWISPDEMIAATNKFLSLIGVEDTDALALVECFIQYNRMTDAPLPPRGVPIPRVLEGEDPLDVGRYRVIALSDLLRNLEGVILTAHNCRRAGIERIAFCYF